MTPDLSRYNKSAADVVKQSIVGIALGEYLIGLIGVLLAHAAQSSDVITIVMGTSGILGTIVLITATIKINDFNLYAPSLAIVNIFDSLFGKQVNRTVVTIVIGIVGTLLSIMGILGQFQGFLSLLGIALPPVGGILVAEYFLVKRYKKGF
ncbi:cytosine permease [Virgibacillus halophilus]|uniref:Cytosine permease n=1 Tax=Tigheibacillus halophilus TaxID=361280 RepID=A0ABU5C915_9BACI|nr:cytosine permease [Virgibacillus halophilus]